MTTKPNKAIHFADGVTVIALQRNNGDVLPCYGKQIFLGYFDTEIEAARARDDAARAFHKQYARLNFPAAHEQAALAESQQLNIAA